ncbi:MAG: hypothetical protein CW742_12135 [Methanoregula sp.]|nr:MAG: hypothetical protein CW742_12135 [Methanoregula sp.]
MGKNNHSVGRYLDNMLVSGQVDMRTYGKAKVFTLSTRVPLNTMLGLGDDLIMVLDRDNRIVRVNGQVLAFFKKPRDSFIGRDIRNLGISEAWIDSFVQKIIAGLFSERAEGEIALPQKGHLVFRMKTIPTVFEDGKKGTTVLLEDITARKRADAALRASEEQFRLMADTVRDGIINHEGDKTTYMNARAEEILGYSKEELASLTPIDLAAPEERERLRAILEEAQEREDVPSDLTLWIQRKDGTRRFIANRIASIRQGQKTICYIISTDMTDWKRTHDALEDQFRFLQHMINTFPNPLYYLDPDGRFLGCNSSFCMLVGKRCDEIVGTTCGTLLEDGRAAVFGERGGEPEQGNGVVTYTGVFVAPDHRRCRLRIQKSGLILADGRRGGSVGLVLSVNCRETLP